ncbi:hypothetical protein C5167_040411 [Papaver somniferum]|uniref:Solute carrier family 35 member F1 n=1 Tax=Papaver somniferum TaxID=3469 RepID=A0A4Y7IEX8_PAPSO|nr:solute carrier family 35 member F1-like [Papaver somniferum]XP_026438494.1 solute carrier family 35 member F1-like [Papaver somniferum]RZC47457.1 hypothetical protein C5167_040411 [Papaver somniferum]
MVDIKKFLTKKTVISLALGQFVSLLITSTGFSSSELARKGINAPTSQSFANYVLLAIVYGGIRIYQKKKLQTKWYYYLLFALFDVEGNFLVVKAYQYTSLTSVMLLDCWTIPCVILFTWLFLKTKYRIRKFIGVAVCVAGLVLVVFSDVHAADRAGGSHPIKGDLLVIAGATLYGVTNTSEEFLVKNVDRVEVMAMLGLFGAIISAIQIAILERNELKAIHWSAGALLPYSGFAAAMFLFYSTVPILLQISGSTMLNLSLLTSDMWAVLIRIFAYHEKVDWMYFIAFAGVVVGLIIYSGGSKEEENKTQVAASGQSTVIDEEAGVRDQNQGSSTLKV